MLIRNSLQTIYTNDTGDAIPAGTGIQIGDALFGVLQTFTPAGEKGTLEMTGVWSFPVADSTTASAGDAAYWNATSGVVATSGGLQIGVFLEDVDGAGEAQVAVFPTGAPAATKSGS